MTGPGSKSDRQAFHIPSLDGIRGIAILMVFGAHTAAGKLFPGGLGVTFFFFLSGYLITTLLRRELERTGRISLRNFYLRRVFRIFPPMYLVLCLSLLFAVLSGRMFKAGTAVAQFLHLTNYIEALGNSDDLVPFTGPFWSLAVEEHFYLVFPPALILMARRFDYARIAMILAAVCIAVLMWRLFLVIHLHVGSYHIYVASDTRIDSILFGCILGLWNNPKLDGGTGPARGLAWLVCGAALLLASLTIRESVFHDTLRYSLEGLALMPLFYCAVRFDRWPIFRWLESPLMRALGLISYMFYLSHMAFLRISEEAFGSPMLAAPVAFISTVAFATASYLLIERRFGVLRRNLERRREPIVTRPLPMEIS